MEHTWQAFSIQDQCTVTGTEQKILDLDNRLWSTKRFEPKGYDMTLYRFFGFLA